MNSPTPHPDRTSLAAWSLTGSVPALDAMSRSGFDWMCVDLQHGGISPDGLIRAARALAGTTTPWYVRVPQNTPATIGFALDLGATGVIVPMVSTRASAEAAVAACYYPPHGTRSWGPMHAQWGETPPSAEQANSSVRCAVMIEDEQGLHNRDEIAATPGVSMIFVGPFDLALSLGISMDDLFALPTARSPLAAIARAARAHGVVAAALAPSRTHADALRQAGFESLVVATDISLFEEGARSILAAFADDYTP